MGMTGKVRSAYLVSLNNKNELTIKKGKVEIKTMSAAAIFYPEEKGKNPLFCSKEAELLYNGLIWYNPNILNDKIKLDKNNREKYIKEDAKKKFEEYFSKRINSLNNSIIRLTKKKEELSNS